ncbi:MAG: mechanosensitive ion channel [Alphaproteobacteria bacterium]|nr:mechanosensitive ion channel [Alphaproteobacteria bacterium]
MNNPDEVIAAGIQDKLQHMADVQHELVTTPPETAEQWHDLIQSLLGGAVDFCLKLIAAIAIFSVGMWIVNKITKSIKYAMERRELEPSLVSFTASFVNILLRIFVIIIVLTTVGVQMTSIVAVLGAGALAVGMALSGTFQNFAGGIIILFLKPFKVGDVIQTASGRTGTVKKIMIFTTELHTFDNQVVFIPNGPLANGEIINLSDRGARRAEIQIAISYGDDVDAARKVIMRILSADKRVLKNPAPIVFVSDLGDSAVVLSVRYWTKFADNFDSMGDLREALYRELPRKKIHFPFPQIDVHVKK